AGVISNRPVTAAARSIFFMFVILQDVVLFFVFVFCSRSAYHNNAVPSTKNVIFSVARAAISPL
ncbi:MAG TPA: hypothetical protein PLY73_02300, partial [Candidatus Ozemobacteraceae bacterium]|nr:hypothetical protein [Candidatus Ozemobacteraceae bacterium]